MGNRMKKGKQSAGLELAVFEMLPQVRAARKVLKSVVGVRTEKVVDWAGC